MKELIACLRKQMQALDDEAAGASEPEQPSGAGVSLLVLLYTLR